MIFDGLFDAELQANRVLNTFQVTVFEDACIIGVGVSVR